MGRSAVDFLALGVGAAIALVITVGLALALRGDSARRGWIAAGILFVVLGALGTVDLVRHSPRETPFSTLVIGIVLPILGTLGMLRGTRRVRRWIAWALAYATAFVLLFWGFLLGAMLARYLPV